MGNSLNRVRSISAFLAGLRLNVSTRTVKRIDATYHFTFTGDEERQATIVIKDQTVEVKDGHIGKADLRGQR